jgi:uncharacterized protein (DUF302 family)
MDLKKLGLSKVVELSPEAAVTRITESLKKEGFGILTEIDVRETLKKKLGLEFPPYKILGACNPNLAHQALTQDFAIGLLLPCNVIVFQNPDGGTTVSIANPRELMSGIDNREMAQLADLALEKVSRALDAL